MNHEHVIVCGGVRVEAPPGTKPVALALYGPDANVMVNDKAISDAAASNVPDVLRDLIELAAYVYAADQACNRGAKDDLGEKWRRHFFIHVPVRVLDVWNRPEVARSLVKTLHWISDDFYTFYFYPHTSAPSRQGYIEHEATRLSVDEVVLFSGGLDSLAGALEELRATDPKRIALVSHVSTTKYMPVVQALVYELQRRHPQHRIHHVAVEAHKSERIRAEFTQRTRSFLYACLAVAVAVVTKRNRIRFYENGVTSMNLALSEQVAGGRATRTTHPITVENFSKLFTTILGYDFRVELPFFWKTKADIVRVIRERGGADLIRRTISCSKTFEAGERYPHCGVCSQCIDRRFATFSAGISDEDDPADTYKVDLFCGARVFGTDRTMVETFVQRARRLAKLEGTAFVVGHPEAARALRHLPMTPDEALKRLAALMRQHGLEVVQALDAAVEKHKAERLSRKLPDTCLVAMAATQRYQQLNAPDTPDVPVFIHEEQRWTIWYQHRPVAMKDSRGVRHLDRIVSSNGRRWTFLELIAAESMNEVPKEPSTPLYATDAKTIRDIKKQLSKIDAQLEGMAAGAKKTKLLSDKSKLESYLKKNTGLRGRPRAESLEDKKARDAVRKSIERAIEDVGENHLELGAHLQTHVHRGNECYYDAFQRFQGLTG